MHESEKDTENAKKGLVGTYLLFKIDLDEGKEALTLFENFILMEQKIKEEINKKIKNQIKIKI